MSWNVQDPADALLDAERWSDTRELRRELREREAEMNEDDYAWRCEE